MGLLSKRKKKPLFGSNITPNCAYCEHNHGKDGKVICSLRRKSENLSCKKFLYNPLKRQPKVSPTLNTRPYSEEDFQL